MVISSPFESSVQRAIAERHYKRIVNDDHDSTEKVAKWVAAVVRIGINDTVTNNILNEKTSGATKNTHSENMDVIDQARRDCVRLIECEESGGEQVRNLRRCIQEGVVEDVKIYLSEADKFGILLCTALGKSCKETPLTLASSLGHSEIVKTLLDNIHSHSQSHSNINECNRFGQTAIHCAAKNGHHHCVNLLIQYGAKLYETDKYGNSPLHYATKYNHVSSLDLILQKSYNIINDVLRGVWEYDATVEGYISMRRITPIFHKHMQNEESGTFRTTRVRDVVERIYDEGLSSYALPKPSEAIVHHVIHHVYAKELSGFWSKQKDGDGFIWNTTLSSSSLLSKIVLHCFLFALVNPIDNMKSTPLHLACQENKLDSHMDVIAALTEKYVCILDLKDIRGLTAFDHYERHMRLVDPDDKEAANDFTKVTAPQYWDLMATLDDMKALQRFGELLKWYAGSNNDEFESKKTNAADIIACGNPKGDKFQQYLHQHTLSPFPICRTSTSQVEEWIEQAWRLIMINSYVESEYSFCDGKIWLQYCHQNSGEIFFYCDDESLFSLEKPHNQMPGTKSKIFTKSINMKRSRVVSTPLDDPGFSDSSHPSLEQSSSIGNKSILHSWSTCRRENLKKWMDDVLARYQRNYYPCQWGCGGLVRIGRHQCLHERCECPRRLVCCPLGCKKELPEYLWHEARNESNLDNIQWHQEYECPERQVCCSFCKQYIRWDELLHHESELCPERPASKECMCNLGCGEIFHGLTILDMHDNRNEHENNFCPYRLVECEWKGCNHRMKHIDMGMHVKYHIRKRGITTFSKIGFHKYTIPYNAPSLLIRLWGAGGGGSINVRGNGSGGGGGFVEAHIDIKTLACMELIIYVGEGGPCGNVLSTEEKLTSYGKRKGFSAGSKWLGGFGGEYSGVFIYEDNSSDHRGIPLLIAGAGGGGGTKNGNPGGEVKTTSSCPDLMGQSNGEGGGEFSNPGISKGGNGGKSYVNETFVREFVCLQGNGRHQGGIDTYRTMPVLDVADKNGIFPQHGQGGNTSDGACGCVEIGLPHYFSDTDPCDKC